MFVGQNNGQTLFVIAEIYLQTGKCRVLDLDNIGVEFSAGSFTMGFADRAVSGLNDIVALLDSDTAGIPRRKTKMVNGRKPIVTGSAAFVIKRFFTRDAVFI